MAITTILFDVGNTLRIVEKDPIFAAQAEKDLMELVGTTMSHDEFFEMLEANWQKYRKLSKKTLLDYSEAELWAKFMLPDCDKNMIYKNSARLTRLWRDHDGRRVARPDVKPTVQELCRRGYKLGIIANTVTETEIPDWMVADGVCEYFDIVLLSSKVRLRKPDPEIYLLACKLLGVDPENCAYIGDNPSRDVEGAVKAGYGDMVVISSDTKEKAPEGCLFRAGHFINELSELLDIYPGVLSEG